MISLLLYKILRMKKYKGFIYRINKCGDIIINKNPIDCALCICSPSSVFYHNEIRLIIKKQSPLPLITKNKK